MISKNVLILLTFILRHGESALPRTKVCLEDNRIAWMSVTPYVERSSDTSNHSGVLFDVFNAGMRACCRGDLNYNFTTVFDTQEDVITIPYMYTVDFILPVQRLLKITSFQHFPFVPLVESPGLAFYVLPDPTGGKVLVHAMTSVTPLVILMFLLVSISGTIFWLCESLSHAWCGRKPQSFIRGVMSGFWWAFVSMTTVGYGDIIPKTKPAKVFSLIWVLIGVAFCALFTSSITTILTLSLMNKDISLPGTEVAVLRGSEEYKYALKKQALPLVFDKIGDLLKAVKTKSVSGALLDAYVAAEYHDELRQVLHLHKIIEHISTNGVVFQNNGFRFVQCIRDYVLSRQLDIFNLISTRVKTLETYPVNLGISGSLIDANDPSFYIPMYTMLGTLCAVIMIGTLNERITEKRAVKELLRETGANEEEDDVSYLQELTLSQWRKDYKQELCQTVMDIRSDADKIKSKADVIMDKIEEFNSFSGSTAMIEGQT